MKLVVDNLTCLRGGQPVLEGVGFRVQAGSALVIRGPNGSGKTTLLRTIAGLQPIHRGEIHVEDDTIAYSSHSDGLKTTLSVSENLMFWAEIYGSGPIEPALKSFGIEHLRDRLVQNLSAGQKRRLGLAGLIVTARPLWVLDEPTVSLDKDGVEMFASVINVHLAGGGIALIATHIDLGITAEILEISQFKPDIGKIQIEFDEAFL